MPPSKLPIPTQFTAQKGEPGYWREYYWLVRRPRLEIAGAVKGLRFKTVYDDGYRAKQRYVNVRLEIPEPQRERWREQAGCEARRGDNRLQKFVIDAVESYIADIEESAEDTA